MTMYEELVKNLRVCSKCDFGQNCDECTQDTEDAFCCDKLLSKAADAIEDLSKTLDEEVEINTALICNMPVWIPVSERLPKTSEDVIVFAYGNMIRIWSLERIHYTTADVYWECEDGSHEEVDVVTHWMPLPEPPESEGE